MATKTYHGSCLCRSVQFELKGEPFTFVVCHCSNCRKVSGSAFLANAFFAPKQVEITRGRDAIKRFRDTNTRSGTPLVRSFCSECGSTLFIQTDEQKYVIVGSGTVDEDTDWIPRRESFPQCKKPYVAELKLNPKPRSKL